MQEIDGLPVMTYPVAHVIPSTVPYIKSVSFVEPKAGVGFPQSVAKRKILKVHILGKL
jgi:hypothetical protein